MFFSKDAILSLLTGSLVFAYALNPTAAEPSDGLCANFAVHAGTAITFAGNTVSGGDVGAGTIITGDVVVSDGTNLGPSDLSFDPAPVNAAWLEATGRGVATTIAAEMGGVTFEPGIYHAATINIAANTDVTLDGEGDYLFQAGTTMTTGAGCNIILTGGATEENVNVVWALGTTFTSGTTNHFIGSILAGTVVTVGADNFVTGSIFSLTAITFGANVGTGGCVICATGPITFGTGNYITADTSPEIIPEITAEVSGDCKCENFAAYAGTALTFGANDKVLGGGVGGAPNIPITGTYANNDGVVTTTSDQDLFAARVNDAWTEATNRLDEATSIAAEMGGVTFGPGIYHSGTFNIAAGTNVILDGQGDPGAEFLFIATSTMLTGAGCNILLTGGATPDMVVWALGTTFTSGTMNKIFGTIRAGSAMTVGANNDIVGNVFAKTAITFGADVSISGCVIALSAITFGADNTIAVVIPEYCQATGAPTSSPTPAPAPCVPNVRLVRKIGGTHYYDGHIPITVISQGNPTGEVTFQISQEWATDNLSNLIVRFQDEYLAFPKCYSFEQVSASWSKTFTAMCTRTSQIALVEVWVSDISFTMDLDIAPAPNCTCDAPISTDLPMVKYVFQVECFSTCPEPCPTTGRMLGSEL
jgi:hypothetical protein